MCAGVPLRLLRDEPPARARARAPVSNSTAEPPRGTPPTFCTGTHTHTHTHTLPCAPVCAAAAPSSQQYSSVYAAIQARPELSTLAAFTNGSALADQLADPRFVGTVFLPTNDALAALTSKVRTCAGSMLRSIHALYHGRTRGHRRLRAGPAAQLVAHACFAARF